MLSKIRQTSSGQRSVGDVFLLKYKGINDVETMYLDTHNSYKLEEGK